MDVILKLTIRQLTGGWRLTLLIALALLPIALALLVSVSLGEDETSNEEFIDALLDALLVSGVLPLVSLVLATAAFGNEVEDRTLAYLVLNPVPRYQIVLGKLLAVIAIGAPIIVVSGVIATVVGDGALGQKIVLLDSVFNAAAAVGIALLFGCVAYSAVFTWAGLISTRALPYGLVYILLWEGIVGSFLGGIRYLSVRGYTLGLVHGLDDVTFAELGDRAIEFPAALLGAIVVTVAFYLLATHRLQQMDVS